MQTNTFTVAGSILAKLAESDTGIMTVRDIQQRLSKPQQARLESALDMLASTGHIEVVAPPPGKVKPGRKVRLLRAPAPEPHCSTCTCYDVL